MSYGIVEIDGIKYIERADYIPQEISITVNGQIASNSINLPGTANFWLKGLTRDTLVNGVSTARRFRYRLGNSDSSIWYMNAGNGGTTDRVLDTLIFGTGQFPFPVVPHIFFSASATIKTEFEDVSNLQPYTIVVNYIGSYLIPVGK